MAEVSNQTSQLIPTNKSLGLIETPENSFSNDLQISDRYQTFSAEMLRLALLGIAAIGFIVVNILLKDSARSRELIVGDNRSFMWFMSASLVCLGVSAAFQSLIVIYRPTASPAIFVLFAWSSATVEATVRGWLLKGQGERNYFGIQRACCFLRAPSCGLELYS